MNKLPVLDKIEYLISHFFCSFCFMINKRIEFGPGLRVKGFPYVQIKNQSKLKIGKNVTLNSSNHNYHISMFFPVKLLADGSNSVIEIGNNTRIHGSCVHAKELIKIGENCLIAANCQIMDNNGHLTLMQNPQERIFTVDKSRPIIIGDNVWIGTGAIILAGTTVGNGSVIGAGSVVSGIFPDNALIAGNPAKVVKVLDTANE